MSARTAWGSLYMGIGLLMAVLVMVSTLRRKPALGRTQPYIEHYLDNGFQAQLQQINSDIHSAIEKHEQPIAPKADHLTIARRISLALVGNGLSFEEVRAFQSQKESEQLQWWTNYLLQDKRWADYFSERFARAFVGTNTGNFVLFRRRNFRIWLAEQMEKETGYDQIVRSMIASKGLWTDTPQVNFLTSTLDETTEGRVDPVRLAGRTSRAFLAQRIDCVECHNDFLGQLNFGTNDEPVGGTQQHFHAIAAFYSGAAIPDPAFKGLADDGRPYDYQYLGESDKSTVHPDVPFRKDLLPSQGEPRDRLAAWVTHRDNQAFARATVNRVWALLFSRPLVEPVDSIPIQGEIPPVLDTLAEDFSSNGFDLKRLIRLIVESDAFQRESRADYEVTQEQENCWAVFPLTQLRPEQVAGNLLQASKLTAIDGSSSILTQLQSFGDGNDFLKQFGDRGEDEFDSEAVTIAQRLVLMNGPLIKDRSVVNLISNSCTRIAMLVKDNTRAIETLFLTVLNREPAAEELSRLVSYLDSFTGKEREVAMGDIFWMLVNVTEFSWNH